MMTNFPDIPEEKNQKKVTKITNCDTAVPVSISELNRITKIIENEEKVQFHHIELVYVKEEDIVEVNKEYLNRDYVTDIITFRYDEDESNSSIEGTLFCCAPRISEQSLEFNVDQKEEYLRIFIHGLLHLLGYKDESEEEKSIMTGLENKYLDKFKSA